MATALVDPIVEAAALPLPATADDLMALPTGYGLRYELVRGEIITMAAAGGIHGKVHAKVLARVLVFVEEHNLGVVFGAETGFKIGHDPDTVRAPDVSFMTQARWDAQTRPQGFLAGAPDLAVEVVSPGDTSGEVHDKTLMWLEAGTRLVWEVQPRSQTVVVHRPDGSSRVLRVQESLDGEDVLRGFTLNVGSIFA